MSQNRLRADSHNPRSPGALLSLSARDEPSLSVDSQGTVPIELTWSARDPVARTIPPAGWPSAEAGRAQRLPGTAPRGVHLGVEPSHADELLVLPRCTTRPSSR
jgi:hypothetical protein